MERRPDTVVITFPTYVDVVVDLKTGETKREFESEFDLDKPVCSTVWAEGELLSEIEFPFNGIDENPDDLAAISQARKTLQHHAWA